jgi:hypothetical protein
VYIDLFAAPFDYQSFDNLPLSLATPSTYSDKIPAKVQVHSMTHEQSDNMAYQNLKTLLSKIEKNSKDAFVVVDSYTSLIAGCDTAQPELDLMEFLNTLQGLGSCSVGFNKDLMSELSIRFLDDAKEEWLVLAVKINKAGYSRDVHGTLVV